MEPNSRVDEDVVLSMQSELREYKKFFDDTPVALFRTDLKSGKFLMANKFCASLLGYDNVDELLSKGKKSNMYSKQDRVKIIDMIRKQGYVTNQEIRLQCRNGRSVWVSASLHINCGGTCIEGSMIDITGQKVAEQELDQFRKAQLSRLSDINSKLNMMIGSYRA